MLVNTADLTQRSLDWAVAVCEGHAPKLSFLYRYLGTPREEVCGVDVSIGERDDFGGVKYSPSTDWSKAGPIIQREGISLTQYNDYPSWTACHPKSLRTVCAETPTEAAMKVYVLSKYSDRLDIPEELMR